MTNERNQAVIAEFRASGGKITGRSTIDSLLLLTTTGAKSGRSHTTPLAYHRDGDHLIVVASMGGAPKNPAWYHNLTANPEVTVEVGSETFRAKAASVSGEERGRLYQQHAGHSSVFVDYEKKTSGTIPVISLQRLG